MKISGRDSHQKFMERAIVLACRGMGRVSPNPLVGAVVVNDGVSVGEGYHIFERRQHAEIVAIGRAGGRARGATLYVNLEPCSHHGRTPPCVDRIVESGLREVFVATLDPNPLGSGKGIRRLREKGVRVDVGLCQQKATHLNEKFFHFVSQRRPFVLLKLALTLDGRIAAPEGDSKWITASRARRYAHRLRYEYDALLVGVHTVLRDDPSLDVRWIRRKPITRVILDSRLRTPPDAKVFQATDPVIIFHGDPISQSRIKPLAEKATLACVGKRENLLDWSEILAYLERAHITGLLIEGGGQVAASALRAGIVQKIAFFYGPKIVGANGIGGIADLGVHRLQQALQLHDLRLRRLSPDFLVEGYLTH